MGKVTVFCLLSGCTPEIAHDLPYHEFDNTYSGFDFDEEDEDYDGHGTLGTLLKSTLIALADAHELASQNDLTVIGPIHPSGEPFSDNGSADAPGGPSAAIARLNPQQDIRSISHCVMGEYWDFGSISAPPESDIIYLVSFGFCIMVQTYALDIMNVATHGRMTPLRVWKLAMQQGFLAPHNECGFKDVDYGEIELAREQFPLPVWLSKYQLKKVEELDDIELKQLVVHDGKFWIWMAPDR
ncbi:hypothetical protein HYDPIDRAFT_86561 [Hydnomerulius pinastri MD-312]|nr:hypothetical protein HYDPIDRAFT_86561 [Hydnomerulius pinastri MD-312]